MLKVAPCTDARESNFFRLDGLLLPFCIIVGLRSASPAIILSSKWLLWLIWFWFYDTLSKSALKPTVVTKISYFGSEIRLKAWRHPRSLLIQDLSMRQIFHTNAGFALCSSVVQLLWRLKSYIVKVIWLKRKIQTSALSNDSYLHYKKSWWTEFH